MALSPDDVRPLHVQIADDLRRQISAGRYRVGDKLPSLRALAETYNVAEPTVHSAIRDLQRAGILVSTSGRGTFVQAVPDAEAPSGTAQPEVEALRTRVDELDRRLTAIEERLHG
ncbi:GntR family transcriptional regulator [Actinopolymorpha sp. NPDC004070]|uniref:GntR family transcriptional regulator n=1 Tax=Actinopolymorpha sp. NPDC004070 TaxID=3154548 RepID=UPI00339E1BE8